MQVIKQDQVQAALSLRQFSNLRIGLNLSYRAALLKSSFEEIEIDF
jgi:hypothetical protein